MQLTTCHPLPHKSGWSTIVMVMILEVLGLKVVWKSISMESGELFVTIIGVWWMEMSSAGAGNFVCFKFKIDPKFMCSDRSRGVPRVPWAPFSKSQSHVAIDCIPHGVATYKWNDPFWVPGSATDV